MTHRWSRPDELRCAYNSAARIAGVLDWAGGVRIKHLARWFLGELPSDYPEDRLRGPQGLKNLKKLLDDETARETIAGHHIHGYPSGVIVRFVRRGILLFNYARLQFWIDEIRDWMAFSVLGRQHRTLEEIATWRDHYCLIEFAYFVISLIFLPSLPSSLQVVVLALSSLLLLDMLGGLAGSALVWHAKSVSYERSFVNSLFNYLEVIVAFAGFYRVCNCLNTGTTDPLQAVYFSVVVATTLGFGDIVPLNSTGTDAKGGHVPVSHLGMFLVIVQLGFFVLFVLVFVNTFLARSLSPASPSKQAANHDNDAREAHKE